MVMKPISRLIECTRFVSTLIGIMILPCPAEDLIFEKEIVPFLDQYCYECHDELTAKGRLSLEQIDPQIAGGPDFEKWRIILERVKFHDMPPAKADQPDVAEREALLSWIDGKLLETQQPGYPVEAKLKLPEFGNYVDHAALFDKPASGPVIPGPPRIWRLRQGIYGNLDIGDARLKRTHALTDPLVPTNGEEFRDYAARYFIDEPTTEMLLANAEKIVPIRSKFALQMLTKEPETPTDEEVRFAIRKTFLQVLRREPEVALHQILSRCGREKRTSGRSRAPADGDLYATRSPVPRGARRRLR